jgi:hypothetical protein
MRGKAFEWLVTAAIILVVIWVWMLTVQDGRRILNRDRNQDPVPYFSKEHGEDEDTNP